MELPKISDNQKKILKSSLVALVIILVLLVLGIIFSKQKNQILKGVVDSQNKTSTVVDPAIGPDGKPLPADATKNQSSATKNTPQKSKGVVGFLRDFFSGNTSSYVGGEQDNVAPVLDSIQKDLDKYKDQQGKNSVSSTGVGLNKYGLASDDPRFIKQFQDAHEQYSQLEEQLHTATAQLQASQSQMASYQAGSTTSSSSGSLFQSTTGTVQNQLAQYQNQVLDLQVQTTFAAIQMAYYFCQGITPGANQGTMQQITLDQISSGSIQLMSDDGTFNYQVCGSLLSWVNDLPQWLEAQGPSLQLTNYLPYLQQILQSATFFYCPALGQPSVTNNAQITLSAVLSQLTNYTPPNCPAAQNTSGQFTNTGGISTSANSTNYTNATPSTTSIPAYTNASLPLTNIPAYTSQTGNYNNATLAITSISPNPVLAGFPVTISWYSTGVDQNTCSIIDITNDPTNFAAGTVIASQKPAIGSMQFTPIQSIGEHIIGMRCNSTQNGAIQQVTDKAKFDIVQSTTVPFVVLSISDIAVITGEPSPKLTWSSAGILNNKCSLYKNGAKVLDNLPKQSTNYQLPIDTTIGTIFYQLACQSEQNTLVPSNAVMYVVSQPGAITVDLKANGQDNLTFTGASQSITLNWTQTGTINSCVGNFASGQLPASYSGTNYTQNVTSSKYFTISCSGPGNQKATDMVLIQKLPATAPLPITVDLKINGQDGIAQTTSTTINGVFTWSSTGPVSSCTSNFVPVNMSPVLPASYSGLNYVQTIEKASYYTISCTGLSGQQAFDTVLVSMANVFASEILYTDANITYENIVAYLADILTIEDANRKPTATNIIAKKLGIQQKTYITGVDEKTNTAVVAGSVKRNNATSMQVQLQILDINKQVIYSSNIFNYSGNTITNKKEDLLPFVFTNISAANRDNSIVIKELISDQILIGPIAFKNLKEESYQNLQVLVSDGFAVKDQTQFPTLLNILAALFGIQIGNHTTGINPITRVATVAGIFKLNNSARAELQLQLLDQDNNITYESGIRTFVAGTRLNGFNQPLPKDTPYPFLFTNIPVQFQMANGNFVVTDRNNFIIKDLVSDKVLYGPQALRTLGAQRVFVNNFNVNAPPWIGIFEIVNSQLKKVLVGMILYTELYVVPILKNFPPDFWQSRSDLSVTVDPQKSYVEEGEMYITGRVATQNEPVQNLKMQLRYGTIPGVTSKVDAQNMAGNVTRGMFKKAVLMKQEVTFYSTNPDTGVVTSSTTMTIPKDTSVTFGVLVKGLDKDKPYFFDIIDANTLVPVLKSLNQ